MAKLKDFPEEGELIVGTVSKVQNFGAFVDLEEYEGKQGFVHIREVAAGWVKRIRDHIREQQRVVCKVQGVDERKGHIDLSLKAVNQHQRREAIQAWKNEQKADKLVEMYCESHDMDPAIFHDQIARPLLQTWEKLYDAFQELAEFGQEVVDELGLEGDWVPSVIEFAQSNIQANFVDLAGFVELQTRAEDGVKAVAAALEEAEKSEFEDVKILSFYKGAPMYRIEVQAPDFKIGEEQLKKAAERAIASIEAAGGTGAFHRELEE